MPWVAAKARICWYLAWLPSLVSWMLWSKVNTGCRGLRIAAAPILLNFFITADVLSCVITLRGRISTKSKLRTGLPSPPCYPPPHLSIARTINPNAMKRKKAGPAKTNWRRGSGRAEGLIKEEATVGRVGTAKRCAIFSTKFWGGALGAGEEEKKRKPFKRVEESLRAEEEGAE